MLVVGLALQRTDAMVLGLAALVVVMAGLVVALRFRLATLSAQVEHLSNTMCGQVAAQLGDFRKISNETTGLVLRSFRDMEMAHRGHAADLQQAKASMESLSVSVAALRPELVRLQGDSAAARSSLDALSARLDATSKDTSDAIAAMPSKVSAVLQAAMAPEVETSGKLMRQLIRQTDALTPKVVASLQAAMAPEVETSGKLMRQILREVGKVPAEVTSWMDNFAHSNEKLNALAYRALAKIQHETMQQAEALIQLHRLFELQAPMPLLGGAAKGWAMEPVTMLMVVEEVLLRKPKLVVECGSGVSTVWIAHALRKIGSGSLVSLEHLDHFARLGEAALDAHGLQGVAEIRHAPLEACPLGGEIFDWYNASALEDVRDVAMLVVDGPPSSTGPLARYPALPLLRDRLLPGALVLIDDVGREDEKRVVERWQQENGALLNQRMISGRTMAFDYLPGSSP